MWAQLKGVRQAWEAANIKLFSIGGQLGGLNRGLEYLTRMVWKRYTVTQGVWRVGEVGVQAKES